MEFKKVGLAFAGAFAASLLISACPGGEGETLYAACASDLECATLEICHPTANVCVLTCETSADCGQEAPTCAAVSATDDTLVCKCSTDEICGSGLECSDVAEVCVPTGTVVDGGMEGCTEGSCPQGEECDTAASPAVCRPATAACRFGTCGAGEVCNAQSQCVQGASCSGEGQSTCDYGLFCESGSCAQVESQSALLEADRCENFQAFEPTWSQTSAGPVIYRTESLGLSTTDSFCTGEAPVTAQARVYAYREGEDWPSQLSAIPGFFYTRVNGTRVDATTLIRPQSGYTPSGRTAQFIVNFCLPADATRVQYGLGFTGGNEVCGDVTQ